MMSAQHSISPPWDASPIHGELILFRRAVGDAAPTGWLMLEARGAVRLASHDGRITYEPGRDFEPGETPRQLHLTADSRIPWLNDEQFFPAPGQPNALPATRTGDRHLLWCEQGLFARHQVLAAYEPTDAARRSAAAAAPDQSSRGATLPTTAACLREGRRLHLGVFGDSIATGCNATAILDMPPHSPDFVRMVTRSLETRCRGGVELTNASCGGMAADWGLRHIAGILETPSDLLILAWGMNDAFGRRNPRAFAAQLRGQIDAARAARGDMDIILVASMTANPDWQGHGGELYEAYRDELAAMCGPGIVLADVTSAWLWLLSRKPYSDLTGNGVNHPNDFGHRVYAAVIDRAIAAGIEAAGL